MGDRTFGITLRNYQIARLYGPGMQASGREGLHENILRAPAGQLGLVLVHCWNLGEPDGPYPLDSGARLPGEAADWVPAAHDIVRDYIGPVLEAARRAGVAVFHLAQPTYARRYPGFAGAEADPELRAPVATPPRDLCVRPRSVEEEWRDQYGPDFPGPVWETHAEAFDIAKAVRPVGGEHVAVDGWQLNGLCRRLGIHTLFYAGFMADLCLVNVPGAMREMACRFRYRCVVLRECTTAYEYEDTREGRWMTRAAIRHIETEIGYSASASDFISAAAELRAGKSPSS